MRGDVRVKVRAVLNDLFAYRGLAWDEIDDEEELTGSRIRLSATEMVYLCYAIERRFHLAFPAECLADYGLLTVSGIAARVETIGAVCG